MVTGMVHNCPVTSPGQVTALLSPRSWQKYWVKETYPSGSFPLALLSECSLVCGRWDVTGKQPGSFPLHRLRSHWNKIMVSFSIPPDESWCMTLAFGWGLVEKGRKTELTSKTAAVTSLNRKNKSTCVQHSYTEAVFDFSKEKKNTTHH